MSTITPIQAKSSPSASTTIATKTPDKAAQAPSLVNEAEIDRFVSTQPVPDTEKPTLKLLLKKASEGIETAAKEMGVPLKALLDSAIESEEKFRAELNNILTSPEKTKAFIDNHIAQAKKQIQQAKDAKEISEEEVANANKELAEIQAKPEMAIEMFKKFVPKDNIISSWFKNWTSKLEPVTPAPKK